LLGGYFIADWVVIEVNAMEHIRKYSLVTFILEIVLGIFGIVAASKRNLWLVGIVSHFFLNEERRISLQLFLPSLQFAN